jgi:hypothetical protein
MLEWEIQVRKAGLFFFCSSCRGVLYDYDSK